MIDLKTYIYQPTLDTLALKRDRYLLNVLIIVLVQIKGSI